MKEIFELCYLYYYQKEISQQNIKLNNILYNIDNNKFLSIYYDSTISVFVYPQENIKVLLTKIKK